MRKLLVAFLVAGLASGIAASAFWLLYGDTPGFRDAGSLRHLGILAGVMALSSVNFIGRWFRWHFLVRRFVRSLPTRTSLKLYFGTLPAFATPLYLGELIRTALAARRAPPARGMVPGIWATERLSDVLALAVFALLAQGRWLGLLALAAAGSALLLAIRVRLRGSVSRELSSPRSVAVLAASSLFSWGLPVLGLWFALTQLDDPVALSRAAETFSIGSLLGGLSLLPLGTGVAGSSMIVQLKAAGVGAENAVAAVVLFRVGTSWYALGLGLLALIRWRSELVSFVLARTTPDHFDSLSSEYDDQIPAHVRDRVVGRKITTMCDWLEASGAPAGARGLEIGCGHGWYAAEMARRGYRMSACDRSQGQVDQARRFLTREGVDVELGAADARSLPFRDERFDFAYGVNVLHHIPGPDGAREALRELLRILKPGGSFFLHEINTENPLFAFYMGYVFPLLRDIDDGTEIWIRPSALPSVEGGEWDSQCEYLTFLPDFVPSGLVERLSGIERKLEASRMRSWSAHYVARLVKR